MPPPSAAGVGPEEQATGEEGITHIIEFLSIDHASSRGPGVVATGPITDGTWFLRCQKRLKKC